jgi:hypothetical protein
VQLLARVDAAVFAPQPLAVQEVRAGQIRPLLGAPEPADRLAVPALGRVVAAQQGPRVRRQRGLTRADRGFDQLGPRPVGKRPVVVPGSLLGRRQRVGVTARPLCKIAVAQCA